MDSTPLSAVRPATLEDPRPAPSNLVVPPSLSRLPSDRSRLPRTLIVAGGLGGVTVIALAVALIGGTSTDAPAAETTGPVTVAAADAGNTATSTQPPLYPGIAQPGAATNGNSNTSSTGTSSSHASTSSSTSRSSLSSAPCATCGTVLSVHAVTVQGSSSGAGAVTGGAAGALVGSQVAGGGSRTVGGIVGAIGGALLGNHIEKSTHRTTAYDVRVRMDDGSVRTLRQSKAPKVGEKVDIEGHTLRPARV
jgi:outer membrane lipoprotein SlyB